MYIYLPVQSAGYITFHNVVILIMKLNSSKMQAGRTEKSSLPIYDLRLGVEFDERLSYLQIYKKRSLAEPISNLKEKQKIKQK